MYVYIVTVQHQDYTWEKISQEGYSTLKLAQQFIENRSDNPQKIDDFRYQSERNIYRIYEIRVFGLNKGGMLRDDLSIV